MDTYDKKIENECFDEERALYNLKNTIIDKCNFSGVKDGESVLKEIRNICVKNSKFSLRYPLWHSKKFELINSDFDEDTRAPIWYAEDGLIENCNLLGIKLLRECLNINVKNSKIDSKEFGWKCKNIEVKDTYIKSEYIFLDSSNIKIDNINFEGKYSFQYVSDLEIDNSVLETKDAFWHSKNTVVKNSIIRGEYLGWYSENLTFINCKIIGAQPLCYCKNLKLINCVMEETNLAFEYSDLEADIIGNIESVKNPKAGIVIADSIDKIINEDGIYENTCKIIVKNK